MEDLTQYSGEEFYRKPPRLDLPELILNGNEGSFKLVTKVKDKWVKDDIGKEVTGVMLRIRRRLGSFKDKIMTSEHNHPNDIVTLFGAGNEKGIAKELREKYQGLKTQQVVYFLLDEKVVKLIVRGASLGSENKPKDSVSFYEYLQSFSKDEHIWEYETKLVPKIEQGKLGKYYAISFERGKKLDDLAIVGEEMKEISDILKAQDEYYKLREVKEKEEIIEELPETEIEEGIRPEDIG